MSEQTFAGTVSTVLKDTLTSSFAKTLELSVINAISAISQSVEDIVLDSRQQIDAAIWIGQRNAYRSEAEHLFQKASTQTGERQAATLLAAQSFHNRAVALETQFRQSFGQTQVDFAEGVRRVFGSGSKIAGLITTTAVGVFATAYDVDLVIDRGLAAGKAAAVIAGEVTVEVLEFGAELARSEGVRSCNPTF